MDGDEGGVYLSGTWAWCLVSGFGFLVFGSWDMENWKSTESTVTWVENVTFIDDRKRSNEPSPRLGFSFTFT